MPETQRLFIAIEPPTLILDWLSRFQDRLAQLDTEGGFRWSEISGVHLTLKFLGDSQTEQQTELRQALNVAVHSIPPLTLKLDVTRSGIFTARGSLPNIVWIEAASDPADRLISLQQAVEKAIAPLGYPTEARRYTPHLTLARARTNARRNQLMAFVTRFDMLRESMFPKLPDDEITWTASSVSLIRSDLRPSGAIYTTLAECALGGIVT